MIFRIVIKEEKKNELGSEDRNENVAAFTIMFGERSKSRVLEKGSCMHHGKFSHEKCSCYELIKYPPGWGTRGIGG